MSALGNTYRSPGLALSYLLNFAGELGSKKGLDRRPWTSPVCPELLCDSVIHILHIHKIFLQLTQEMHYNTKCYSTHVDGAALGQSLELPKAIHQTSLTIPASPTSTSSPDSHSSEQTWIY